MLKLVSSLAAFILILGVNATALAASGTALGVDPDAEARGDSGNRVLVVGADLFIGDRVVTGASGLVQIMFSDKTELVVGPNSSMVLEDYLLREDGSAGKLAINALSGTFRFVTGGAPKDRYIITTPTGTIGVRGTSLDFYVTLLKTYILQLHGSTIDCPENDPGNCGLLDAVCEYGELGSSEMVVLGHPSDLDSQLRNQLKAWFIANDQSRLLRQFRVSGAEQCLRRAATQQSGGSLVDTSIGTPPKSTTPTPPQQNPTPPTTPPIIIN